MREALGSSFTLSSCTRNSLLAMFFTFWFRIFFSSVFKISFSRSLLADKQQIRRIVCCAFWSWADRLRTRKLLRRRWRRAGEKNRASAAHLVLTVWSLHVAMHLRQRLQRRADDIRANAREVSTSSYVDPVHLQSFWGRLMSTISPEILLLDTRMRGLGRAGRQRRLDGGKRESPSLFLVFSFLFKLHFPTCI